MKGRVFSLESWKKNILSASRRGGTWGGVEGVTGGGRGRLLAGQGELVQIHDDRDISQAWPKELPVIDIPASDEIPCHGAEGPRKERLQGRHAPTRKILP